MAKRNNDRRSYDKSVRSKVDSYFSDSDDDSEDILNPSSKRPRIMEPVMVELPPFQFQNNDINTMLRGLGEQLVLVADARRDAEVDKKYTELKNNLEGVLSGAFRQTRELVDRRVSERRAVEMEGMGQEDILVEQNLRAQFLIDISRVTDQMTATLTHGAQAAMFRDVLAFLNNEYNAEMRERVRARERLEIANMPPQPELPELPDMGELRLMSEITSIVFTQMMSLLSVVLVNIYNVGPAVARQTIAVLTAQGMIYNYLPEMVRNAFVVIPYFGPLFEAMNRINPQLVLVQNTATALTTIYYLLRNAGIDTAPAINSMRNMVTTTVTNRLVQFGRALPGAAVGAITSLQTSVSTLSQVIANRLGDILTTEYQNVDYLGHDQVEQDYVEVAANVEQPGDVVVAEAVEMPDAQHNSQQSEHSYRSASSGISINSARTVNSNRLSDTAVSNVTVLSVEQLLGPQIIVDNNNIENNIDNGGIDLSVLNNPPEIVRPRFDALVEAIQNPDNPPAIINTPLVAVAIEQADEVSRVAVAIPEAAYSQDSDLSNVSDMPQSNILSWLFGDSERGGRRRRKVKQSKRKGKSMKTKKRKGMKRMKVMKGGRNTKKGKKHLKTLKRYRSKMHR